MTDVRPLRKLVARTGPNSFRHGISTIGGPPTGVPFRRGHSLLWTPKIMEKARGGGMTLEARHTKGDPKRSPCSGYPSTSPGAT